MIFISNVKVSHAIETIQGLTSPRARVTYGERNINDIIKSLITLDMEKQISYNV